MRRNNVVTFSLVLSITLVIGVTAPRFDLGRNAQHSIEVPTVSGYCTENIAVADSADGPATITAVIPPYIIFETIPNQIKNAMGHREIRISIQTMIESYSEFVTSKLIPPKALLKSFGNSDNIGSNGGKLLPLFLSD